MRAAALTALATVLLLAATGANANARTARHCARSGERQLAADTRGRVYIDRHHDVYACLRTRELPVLIAEAATVGEDVYGLRVASRYIAFLSVSPDALAPSWYVSIYDMRKD